MYWNSVDFAEVYLDIGGCMALDICCYSDVGIGIYIHVPNSVCFTECA